MSEKKNNRPTIDSSKLKGIDWGPLGSWDITKISDEDLQNAILFVWSRSPGNFKHDAVASFLVSETNRRLTEQMKHSNDKTGRIGFGISLLALLISLASIIIGVIDYRSGNKWQDEEISLLKEQVSLLKDLNQKK